jgi:hypothetical protein
MCSSLAGWAFGAPPVDVDYAFQGEFVSVEARPTDLGRFGLQVVAQGGGKFDAVVLPGGMPGAGWNRRERFALSGKLGELSGASNGAVLLRGYQFGARVTGNRATLRDTSGRLHVLRRITRVSPTLGAAPSRCAIVLFREGRPNERYLIDARLDAEGYLRRGFATSFPVGDFHLHIEFRTPYMPAARGQSRGNSGVYIQRRYEIQILDSFGLAGAKNECGALYKQREPEVNMCLPPLVWQTYDVDFIAARWGVGGEKLAPARVALRPNGVVVQDAAIVAKTGAGKEEAPHPLPILFQDHGDEVVFRNVWIECR